MDGWINGWMDGWMDKETVNTRGYVLCVVAAISSKRGVSRQSNAFN